MMQKVNFPPEKSGVYIEKESSRAGESGYIYQVVSPLGRSEVLTSYSQAKNLFEQTLGQVLEQADGDCPQCGGNLQAVRLGSGRMQRWAQKCGRCGYIADPDLDTCQKEALKQVRPPGFDAPDHRVGRTSVHEIGG